MQVYCKIPISSNWLGFFKKQYNWQIDLIGQLDKFDKSQYLTLFKPSAFIIPIQPKPIWDVGSQWDT